MLTRYSAQAVLGSALMIAILALPGIASAQNDYEALPPAASAPDYGPQPAYEPPPAFPPPVYAPARSRVVEGRSVAVERRFTIDNRREVPLVQLSVVPVNSSAPPQIVAQDIGSGQRVAALVAGSGCTYDVSGIYADQSEVAPTTVDLCRSHTLNLTQ